MQSCKMSIKHFLVGFSRRNLIVPVPHLANLSELNAHLSNGCDDYKSHSIPGREGSVGVRLRQEKSYFYALPKYRFDKNNYSVPANLIGKDATVKAYGNHINILYHNKNVASYIRLYGQGNATSYTLEHYMPLLEQNQEQYLMQSL